MDQVAPLRPDQLDVATATLARAFASDPMFDWVFPDPAERVEALRHLNRVPLRYGLRDGYVTQSADGKAVSIWMPPGKSVSGFGMIRSGMLAMPFRVGFRPLATFMIAMGAMEEIHKRALSEPHWYLMIVGVDPDLQGQGRGAALLHDGLARADGSKVPCYLETSEPTNLGFYERLGFSVIESTRLGDGGPEAWAMLRPARP